MKKLEGKVAVVTGGNGGIGLATARRFAAEGAYVFITGRRREELDAAVRALGGEEHAAGVQGDVASLADLDRLFATVKEKKGRVDVLFANAGVAEGKPLSEVTEKDFDWHFDINVKGVFFTVQKALPLLSDGASIILNGSIVGSKGPAALSVYSATKGAVRSFARTFTTDLKDRRIRVNVVSPGATATPGLATLWGENADANRAGFESVTPLGRMAEPDEIAKAVLFLATDDASYVTGVELFVDGGLAQV